MYYSNKKPITKYNINSILKSISEQDRKYRKELVIHNPRGKSTSYSCLPFCHIIDNSLITKLCSKQFLRTENSTIR